MVHAEKSGFETTVTLNLSRIYSLYENTTSDF